MNEKQIKIAFVIFIVFVIILMYSTYSDNAKTWSYSGSVSVLYDYGELEINSVVSYKPYNEYVTKIELKALSRLANEYGKIYIVK